MAVFETSLVIDGTIEQAFDFLIRPANHEKLSPPGVGLRFVNPPEEFVLGTQFEFKIQSWGLVHSSKHEIIEFDRPDLFVEQQIQGPLKYWRHEHRFETNTEGKVVIIDIIDFAPPGGILGMMATESVLLENLEDGFYHRHQQLRKLLKGTE
jgi:ligand-binding SRPBCC domain-containing protein